MRKVIISWLTRTALVVGVLGAVASTSLAAKPDFSEFGGTYKGTWLITAPSISYGAAVTGDVTVRNKGAKASIDLSGLLSVGPQSVAIQTTLQLDSKRRVRGTGVLLGFAGPVATNPSRFTGSKSYTFTLSAVPGASLLSFDITGTTMIYTLKFSKKTLTISGSGTLVQEGSSTPIQIFVNLRKSGKK